MSLYTPRLKKQHECTWDLVVEDTPFGQTGVFTISCGLMDGMSVANAIRRNLLTKSVGYAAVAYKIAGAESPFDCVSGFNIPINLIVDNISKIQFDVPSKEDFVIANVQFSNKYTGVITAGMFATQGIEVHNPDLVICEVSAAMVNISIGVGLGYGYISEAEQREYFEMSEGWFVKDAIFNPILSVTYTCDSSTALDLVVMKVTAQANCDLKTTFESSKRDLSYIFGVVADEDDHLDSTNEEIQCQQFLDIDLNACLELSMRSKNALTIGGVHKLGMLLSFSPSSLVSKVSGIGQKSIEDVGSFLSKYANEAHLALLRRNCDDKIVRNMELYVQSVPASMMSDEKINENEEEVEENENE